MKRTHLFMAVLGLVLVIPLAVNSQQPGGDNGGGRRGGRGYGGPGGGGPGGDGGSPGGRGGRGMFFTSGGDPMQFFDNLAKGRDVIRRDDLDPMFQRMFDRMAQSQGITNGQITRDQFKTAMESFRSRMGGGPGGNSQGAPGGPPNRDTETPEQMDRQAEDSFRKRDKNGDGQLDFNEMNDTLKTVWEKYDHNNDGMINLDEYKAYYRDRMEVRRQEQAQSNNEKGQPASEDGLPPAPEAVPVQEEDEKRPTVYRAGKFPKELPTWFAELDLDKDGQVGLYEWVRAGRSVDEFRAMDRNDDGLLTVDEVLCYVRVNTKPSPGSDAVAAATPGGGDDRSRGGFGGPGGFFGGRGGRGGPGAFGGTNGGENGGAMQGQGPWSGGGRGGRGGPGGFGGRGGNRGGDSADNSRGGRDNGSNGGEMQRPGRGGRGGRGGAGFDRSGGADQNRDSKDTKDSKKP